MWYQTAVNLLAPTATGILHLPSPTITPPDCTKDWLCDTVLHSTGSPWLAAGSYILLVKPLRILSILLVALLVRYLLCRTVNRLVRSSAAGGVPSVLRPLKERLTPLQEATGTVPERRRQRAAAIGSVLRSVITVVIFSVAALMVLAELSINLAPLLASAGIVGLALGFGAQALVKDLIAGLFMLLEDQYGVGDVVDLGDATGTVEAIGLRVTTVRDSHGVLWYLRNGEITRVGNKSQGWAVVVVDVPIGFADVSEATQVLRDAAAAMAADPDWKGDLIEGPEVLGVEQITVDGAVLRTQTRTRSDVQFRVGREVRRRLTDALGQAGIHRGLAERMHLRPARPDGGDPAGEPTQTP
jgi:small-conductance mechanosensitive channel